MTEIISTNANEKGIALIQRFFLDNAKTFAGDFPTYIPEGGLLIASNEDKLNEYAVSLDDVNLATVTVYEDDNHEVIADVQLNHLLYEDTLADIGEGSLYATLETYFNNIDLTVKGLD